jgi:Fic family protein
MPAMATKSTIDQKLRTLEDLLGAQDEEALAEFQEALDMSWIYHDTALEGTMLTFHELKSAIDKDVVSDVSLIPTYDEIRAHKAAIDFVRECAMNKKKVPLTTDLLLRLQEVLSPDDVELKPEAPYRKDTPVHRLYFHDIAPPDKIVLELKKLDEWLKSPDTKKTHTPLRLASKLHFRLMQVFPYSRHMGKLARLMMNLVLLRSGYPPAIIHSTERQRYYESLKGPSLPLHGLMVESLENSIDSAIKRFSEARSGRRAMA